jgi:hypothetical protein
MADCEKLAKCLFFADQLVTMPAVANLMKESYCRGDSQSCARYRLSSRGIPVPPDLLPNDNQRAAELLGQQ